jgi:hypothetical protein
MEKHSYQKADIRSTRQEILSILWNPKTRKRGKLELTFPVSSIVSRIQNTCPGTGTP